MTWRRSFRFWLLLLTASASTVLPSAAGAASLPTNFVDEIIVGGLAEPTSFAFLPDGRVLFTEQRTGRVRMVVGGHIASTDPILVVPNLNASGNERGLLAITVDPRWPTEPHVYLYYTRGGGAVRLVRYTAEGSLNNPAGEVLMLTTPLVLIDDIPDLASNHNGGALRFGPDQHLYLSIGEDADRCAAQDSTRLKGVLLRLDVAGLPPGPGGPVPRAAITPDDNPLSTPDSNARLVWAYGLRNPFRFHPDPATQKVYLADVGENTIEEMDEVEAGDNLGWPFREGPLVMPVVGCLEPGGPGTAGYRGPIATYDHSVGQSVISGGIYRPVVGALYVWPLDYWGDVFFADYYGGFLRRIKNTGGTWAPASAPGQPNPLDWASGLEQPVDFMIGSDGSLWWMSQFDPSFSATSGSLHRIRYTIASVDAPPVIDPSLALTAAPTPFRGRVELGFGLATAAGVRLAIYDLTGREVRRLFEGRAGAGRTQLAWDGRDQSGREAPAGVYLACLDRPDGREVTRVLRLR
jgi:glucose/arabinose dehydrogenase